MCRDITELSIYAPQFAGQKTYCVQSASWYIATLSLNSNRLVWTVIPRSK